MVSLPSLKEPPRAGRWKRIVLRVMVGVAVASIIAVAFAWLLWTRLTALPDWAVELAGDDAESPGAAAPVVDGHWVDEPAGLDAELDRLEALRPPGVVGTTSSPKRDARKSKQLRNFHLRKALEDPILRKATRASKAEWNDGTLEAGLVIDLSVVEGAKLGESGQRFYSRAKSIFPGLGTKKVYVALIDKSVTVDGYLQLSESPSIRVGEVEMSLSRVSRRLGLDPAKVRRALNKEMRRLELRDPSAVAATASAGSAMPEYDGPI